MCAHVKPDWILIRGDINCDFNRNGGFVHTISEYMIDNNLHNIWDAYPIDYTYIHTDKESTSTIYIGHVLVNSMIYDIYVAGEVHHQYSDGVFHSRVYMCINVDSIPG